MSATRIQPSRLMEQVETIARLNALSNLDWTVEADALDVDEWEGCANDTDHGLGTCYFDRGGNGMCPEGTCYFDRGGNGMCPDCAVNYLTRHLLAGDYISVDVTR
jgi:hypothetical protein